MKTDTKAAPLCEYIKEKMELLEKEFHIRLTARERLHFYSLQSEIAVDNYARKLFVTKL